MPAPPPPPPPLPPAPRPTRWVPPVRTEALAAPEPLEPPAQRLELEPPPAPARSLWPRLAAVAVLAAAFVLVLVVLLSAGGDDRTAAPQATATPARTPAATPTPTPTPAASGTRSITGDGFAYTIPSAGGWTLSAAQGGALTVRRLTGPDGELIRIAHSPAVRAAPIASTVVSEAPFDVPSVPDARKYVLQDFPSDRCAHRRCDDYVLNDEAFGGLAILAGDSGGPASRMAARIARSVTVE